MLQLQTVDSGTFDFIKTLNLDPELSDFFLVGGTALALHIGHRKSIDIDLFTQKSFDVGKMLDHLNTRYGFVSRFIAEDTLKGRIDNVAVDLISHPYPLVLPLVNDSGIRLASTEDIAAMKLRAITFSGTRSKDYVDISFLLKSGMRLSAMLEAFEKKYPGTDQLSALRALVYFDDVAIKDELPQLLMQKFNWSDVKDYLIKEVNKFITGTRK